VSGKHSQKYTAFAMDSREKEHTPKHPLLNAQDFQANTLPQNPKSALPNLFEALLARAQSEVIPISLL